MTKNTWGGEGLFCLHFLNHSPLRELRQELKQIKNVEAGADWCVEDCSLACSASFLIELRTTSPRVDLPAVGCALPIN